MILRLLAVAVLLLPAAPARAMRVSVAGSASLGARTVRVAPVAILTPRLAPSLKSPALSSARLGAALPSISVPAAARLAPAAAAAEPALTRRGFAAAASLTRAFAPVRRAESRSAAARGGLDRIYVGRTAGSAELPVPAAASATHAPSLYAPAPARAHGNSAVPEPGSEFVSAPEAPSWGSRVWAAVKTVGALGLGLYGGLQIGDIAYSFILGGTGWAGLAGVAAGLGTAAFFLRRRAGAGQGSVLLPALAAGFGTAALGQLIADVSGWGLYALGAGALIGLAAGLYAGGVGSRKS